MPKTVKRRIMLFAGIAVTAMLLLAVSLPGLNLLPGKPFSLEEALPYAPMASGASASGAILLIAMRVIMFLAWLLFPITLIYLIVSPDARKRFFKLLMRVLPFVLAFILIAYAFRNLARPAQDNQPGGGLQPPGASTPLPPSVFVPTPPYWLVLAVSLILALLITVLVATLLWFLLRRGQPPDMTLADIATETQSALDTLQAGGDIKDTVMRCYCEMSQVLYKKRAIQRGKDMTPREFERLLTEKGLPGEPIQRLTRLFEEVRYGSKAAGNLEKHQAIQCLSAIVDACGRSA